MAKLILGGKICANVTDDNMRRVAALNFTTLSFGPKW